MGRLEECKSRTHKKPHAGKPGVRPKKSPIAPAFPSPLLTRQPAWSAYPHARFNLPASPLAFEPPGG